ncbi:hypothetical protein PG991_009194 [Apiospora marii]|uniref:Uncharacterized protein n=1 Tax=Apiospora marii TaxID=335849 RepID=A0ABR1RK19_9PEZI
MAVYGVADSCYEYDASEEEVSVSPEPRTPRSRLVPHEEARCIADATKEISAILMQKLERFQGDLRLYQREKSRSRDELEKTKNEMMQELCMAKERLLEELASATMARMEGVEPCPPLPRSESRPRPPSPRKPGSHAAQENGVGEVAEVSPETQPLQVELPNAKLASQIAPSRPYMHDKREKDKIRKSGESLQRKALALGEMCNVFSLTMYWNIVRGRMDVAMYVPEGQKIPDLGQVIRSLRGRQARVTQRARVFQTSRRVQKPSSNLSRARDTGQGSAVRPLRSQRRHSAGTGHLSPQPMSGLTGCLSSAKDADGGTFAVQQGAPTTRQPSDQGGQGSPRELVTGSAVNYDPSRYDTLAGNTRAGVASGLEGADAAIGNGAVATPGGSQPTPLEPGHCQPLDGEQDMCDSSLGFFPNAEFEMPGSSYVEDVGWQEMEGLHDQYGDAGHPSKEMSDMLSATVVAQEVAGGPATEGSQRAQPRSRSPSAGYPAQIASPTLSFSQGLAMDSAKNRRQHGVSMDACWPQRQAKGSLDYILM